MRLSLWRARCESVHGELAGRFLVAESEAEVRRDRRRQAATTWFAMSDERAVPSDVIGIVRQVRTVGVAAVTRIPNLRPDAAAALDGDRGFSLRSWRETLDEALLGWQPGDCVTPVSFRAGQMLPAGDDGAIWWGDTYETQRLVSQD